MSRTALRLTAGTFLLVLAAASAGAAGWVATGLPDWFAAVPAKCGGAEKCHINPPDFAELGLTETPKSCSYLVVLKQIWKKPSDRKEYTRLRMEIGPFAPMARSPEEIVDRYSQQAAASRVAFDPRRDFAVARYLARAPDRFMEFYIVPDGKTFAGFWVIYTNSGGPAEDCRDPQFRRVFERVAYSIGKDPPRLPLVKQGSGPKEVGEPPAAAQGRRGSGPPAPTGPGHPLPFMGGGRGESPNRAQAQRQLKDAADYLQKGSLYLAEQRTGQALETDPGSVEALALHALIMRLAEDGAREAEDLRRLRERKADPTRGLQDLLSRRGRDGLSADRGARAPEALAAYDAAMRAAPNSWILLALRGFAKLAQKDCAGGRSDLRAAVLRNPNFAPHRTYAETCGSAKP